MLEREWSVRGRSLLFFFVPMLILTIANVDNCFRNFQYNLYTYMRGYKSFILCKKFYYRYLYVCVSSYSLIFTIYSLYCLYLLKTTCKFAETFIIPNLILSNLICVYLKAGCGLEFLAELDFLLVWTLDGEELYTVLPEWKTIYLLIQHLEGSGFLYY